MKIEIVSVPKGKPDLIRFVAKGAPKLPEVPSSEFDGAKNSTVITRSGGVRTLHVGIGESAKATAETLRQAAGTALKQLLKIGADTVAIEIGQHVALLHPIVEGALLAAYRFEEFRMPEARRKNPLKSLLLIVAPNDLTPTVRKAAQSGQIYAEATNYVRALGNLPGNRIYPSSLAEAAQKLSIEVGLTCKIWDEPKLKKEGFGGILAVGQGSAQPPRFIVLEYHGGKKSEAPIALVGKAITFDSGGISIKPSDRMDEMKFDKMGGVTVLGILKAVSALKLPINVVGLIASAENMPGDRAYRPGDIVTTYNGKTVEVLNTDAEGRIVLADALSYAEKNYQPRLMFDFATLTGACIVALGAQRAGIFTTDEVLRNDIWQLGPETGDRVWPLPFGDEFQEQIKSDVALVKNTGGREGGACTAASFLSAWVEKTPWMHIDLAGPAWITKDLPYLEKGATGFGVRLITEYLRKKQ
jgi:leucyl aminopeptidase